MRADAGFLEAICESPDDDAPRLVYADWLDEHGDPARAEFIRVQCTLARLGEDDPARDLLEPRERALLAEHGDAWRRDLPPSARKGAVFRRGFVERVTLKASLFVKQSRALFQAAPVRHAWLTYPIRSGPAFLPDPALAACPFLGRLRSLKVGGDLGSSRIGDAGARTLAAPPHLTNLEDLDLSGNDMTAEGVRAVAESPHLTSLSSLNLGVGFYGRDNAWPGDEGAAALAASPSLANLRELSLDHNRIGPAGVAALASSPHLRRLVRLDLSGNPLGPEGSLALARSGAFPHLTTLNLDFARINSAIAAALLASRNLSRLTDVELGGHIDLDKRLERVFAGAAGGRLTRLTLNSSDLGDEVFRLLAPLRLRSLGLESNRIGPGGVRLLANLPLLEGLRELDLSYNQLGDAGVQAMTGSLRAGNLRALNLAANNVNVAGAEALARSPHLARLRVLVLHHNKLRDAGGRALAASPHLNNLNRLVLHGNGVVKATRDELKRRFGSVVTL